MWKLGQVTWVIWISIFTCIYLKLQETTLGLEKNFVSWEKHLWKANVLLVLNETNNNPLLLFIGETDISLVKCVSHINSKIHPNGIHWYLFMFYHQWINCILGLWYFKPNPLLTEYIVFLRYFRIFKILLFLLHPSLTIANLWRVMLECLLNKNTPLHLLYLIINAHPI